MNRTILIASNDLLTREIAAKFFNATGFFCICVNFDEQLLVHADRFKPHALISDVSFKSRYFSSSDSDSALTYLLAVRCRFPRIPILITNKDNSPAIAEKVRRAKMTQFFAYPLDLVKMLETLRVEMRRLSRLKFQANIWAQSPGLPHEKRRGRPRKYPVMPAMQEAAA